MSHFRIVLAGTHSETSADFLDKALWEFKADIKTMGFLVSHESVSLESAGEHRAPSVPLFEAVEPTGKTGRA